MSDVTDLTKRLTIAECVAVYHQAVADMRSACALIADAENRLNVTFDERGYIQLCAHDRISFDKPERNLEEVRRRVWSAIVERTEVRRMLSITRAEELDRWLKNGELPEITLESVEDLARSFAEQLPSMLEEAVEEVFNLLRPRRSKYKTNTELEIGSKVILSHVVEKSWSGNFQVNHYWNKSLTALENVFSALDGNGQISKGYYSALATAINGTSLNAGTGETPYFKFKCFLNGNLHIEFRRLDLLARLNQIAGGARLKPAKTG